MEKDIAIIVAGMEAACKEHGVRGFLEHKQIEAIKSNLDPDEVAPRIYGKFMHLQGLVFKKFKRAVHVIEPFPIDPYNFSVYMALDPHTRTEDAVLWVAVAKDGTMYVVDEIFENTTISGLIEKIHKKEYDNNYRVVDRIIDPSAQVKDQHTGYSLYNELLEAGLYFRPGSKERDDATRAIKEAIHWEGTENNIIVPPRIFFFNTVRRLIWEMEHLRWREWRGRSKITKAPPEKPIDKDDHEIENLGRILLEKPRFIPYGSWTKHGTTWREETLD